MDDIKSVLFVVHNGTFTSQYPTFQQELWQKCLYIEIFYDFGVSMMKSLPLLFRFSLLRVRCSKSSDYYKRLPLSLDSQEKCTSQTFLFVLIIFLLFFFFIPNSIRSCCSDVFSLFKNDVQFVFFMLECYWGRKKNYFRLLLLQFSILDIDIRQMVFFIRILVMTGTVKIYYQYRKWGSMVVTFRNKFLQTEIKLKI